MFEKIIVFYSFNNPQDQAHVKALSSHPLWPNSINIDISYSNQVVALYDACKNQLSRNSLLLAVGDQGLEALCILHDARRLDNLRAKIGLSIQEYNTKIEELQFTLSFIAIPQVLLDNNQIKIIASIEKCIGRLYLMRHQTPERVQEDAMYVADGINALSKDIQSTWQLITQRAEWLAGGVICEAARREYITPVQAMVACVPLLGMYLYRRHMTSVSSAAPAMNTSITDNINDSTNDSLLIHKNCG